MAAAIACAALVVLAGCSGAGSSGGGVDSGAGDAGGVGGGGDGGASSGGASVAATESVGVSAGGAQDAGVFREGIREGYVPQPTDVEYEGLFHDYYFDTGSAACDRRFCPTYSRAVTADPLSGATERYLTVGLTSGLTEADLERPPTDLIVVVDTSGSMDEVMDRYHYDGASGGDRDSEATASHEAAGDDGETGSIRKIAAARSAVRTLVGKLRGGDRLGVVAYDDTARVVQELRRVDEAGRDRLRRVPDRLRADGSTNLDAGMRTARRMAERRGAGGDEGDGGERMTRVVYVTDAMPNQGQLDARTLRSRLSGMADGGIHSTFVGVGVDFNSRLVNALGAVEGANYYTVDSAERFDRRMSDGFRYMTTPIAFDLSVSVESDAWRVARVYGAPGSATDGELLHVNTLFPSRRQDGGNEGGVILAALDPRGDPRPGPVRLTASYRTPDGERHEVTRTVRVGDRAAPFYGSTGARKAVALSRYADLVRNWAAYERRRARGDSPERPTDGVESRTYDRGRWEQTSVSLRVSDTYRERFAAFEPYFHAEVTALGADRMRKELRIVRQLAGNTSAVGTSTAGRVRPAIGSAATGVTGT